MTYHLGIDLGTTYTAAATFRDNRVQITELGNRSATTPSVIFLREDETILAGDAANRRALTESHRVAREFKRRIGDPTPLLLGGSPYSAESLSAKLLRWVIDRVTTIQGEPPAAIAVTYPANWGPFKLDLLQQALRLADISGAVVLTEPEAAAIHHATLEPLKDGMTVAVFDLGGGTFDAVVLRKTADSFEILGEPEGIERLGGIDFDEAVFGFVVRALGGVFEELDPTDALVLTAINRLRAECVDGKEALSSDTEVTIPVVLPNVQTEVRLTRAEFEQMIRPSLADAVDALRRAVRSAGLELADIDLALLVGGSSRIPLVGQMLGGELGLPIAVHAHPKHVVALGAARYAAKSESTRLAASAESGSVADETFARPGAGDTVVDMAAVGGASRDTSTGGPALTVERPVTPVPVPVLPRPVTPVPVPVLPRPVTPVPVPVLPRPAPAAAPDRGATLEMSEMPAQPVPVSAAVAPPRTGEAQPFVLPQPAHGSRDSRTRMIAIGAVIAVAAIVAGLFVAMRGGDDADQAFAVTVVPTPTSQAEATTTIFEPTAPPTGVPQAVIPAATPSPLPTALPTPTEAPTVTPAVVPFTCAAGFCAHIERIEVVSGELLIDWTAHGYTPSVANFHAHFYFDTFEATEVGTNYLQLGASRQGSWQVTDRQPFSTAGSAVSMASIPAGASQICVVPADSGHGVTSPENAECWALPPSVLGR